jgi:phage terminase large subunit GpA-like protein
MVHRGENVKLDWEPVRDRRETWLQRTIPDGYHVLTAGADVQGDRIEIQELAWGPGDGYGAERCAVVDYVVYRGDPTQAETWVPVLEYLRTPIANSQGRNIKIACTLIDAGYCQHEVLAFTHANRADRIFACRGAKTLTKAPIGRATLMDVNFRGKAQKRGAELYWLGVGELKKRIYARLRADGDATPAERFIRFNADLPDNYFRMLCAETFDAAKGKWVLVHERNESLDVTVYGFAAAEHHSLQITRWREADWKRVIEQQQAPKGAEDPSPRFMPTRAPTR